MKYLVSILILISFFSCEEITHTTSYQEVYILYKTISGVDWYDKDCTIDSTYLKYEKWNQVRRFIANVNGIYSVYQTIENSDPIEHYIYENLDQDWITIKGDSLLVTSPSDFCHEEYPQYLHTDEKGNCSAIGLFGIPKKKHLYYCIEYPDIYVKGHVENSPK